MRRTSGNEEFVDGARSTAGASCFAHWQSPCGEVAVALDPFLQPQSAADADEGWAAVVTAAALPVGSPPGTGALVPW